MTVGTISARTGIGKGTLFSEYARLSEILKPCTERLLELYRLAPVKGADETTWRCDGQNGYVYGFFTQDVALFRFRGTRKMCVAEEVFGEGDHIGVLVRDRFPGYDNSFKGKQQYCFEHLKRDCKELLEKEPQNAEYQKFVPAFVSLLREAMQLRGRGLEDGDYYDETERNVRTRRPTDGHRTEGLRAMDPGICIPDLLFPLPTHKAELSRRRAGARRV